MGFEEAVPWPLVWAGFFLLSHEPLYINRTMPYAHVFGHVHVNPAYRDASARSVCVSVERTGFAPPSFEELRVRLGQENDSVSPNALCELFSSLWPPLERLFLG